MKQFYLILISIGLFVLSSCTNDRLDDFSDDSEETFQMEEGQKAMSVINAFCDPVMDGDSIVGYRPRLGKQLDESKPTVYSIACDSIEEVREILNSFFYPLFEGNPDYLLPVYDFKSFGKIMYCEGKDGTIAQLKIGMSLLPNVKEINFITHEKWPENDIPGSPYGIGDIVANHDKTEAYICVRACSGGLPGLLLGCKKPEKDSVSLKYQHFNLPIKYAKKENYNAMAYMYFTYPNMFCQAIETICLYMKIPVWANNQLVKALYYSANANNRNYYYDKLSSPSKKQKLDLLINEILSDIKDNKIVLCACGYENRWKWRKSLKAGKHEVSVGEYYVFSLEKEIKQYLPVFKQIKTVSWNKDRSPELYDDDFYSFIELTFNEFDKQYQIIDLPDDFSVRIDFEEDDLDDDWDDWDDGDGWYGWDDWDDGMVG